ncbi:MAG: hypothetical protein V1670_05645 [Candidatus Omnitrophota bacterium]
MPKKPKFKPVITRVKLNPEQAVLSCTCYQDGGRTLPAGGGGWHRGGVSWFCGIGGNRGSGTSQYKYVGIGGACGESVAGSIPAS